VAEAIAQTRPFAVDSASGTESAPGKKDERKLRAFFAAVESSAADDVEASDHATVDATSPGEAESAEDLAETIEVADATSEGAAA
jgi:hypothetical protein